MSAGALVGGIVGGVFAGIALAGLAFYMVRRSSHKRLSSFAPGSPADGSTTMTAVMGSYVAASPAAASSSGSFRTKTAFPPGSPRAENIDGDGVISSFNPYARA